MVYETILYERKDKIVYITLNRPDVLNAMNDTMGQELIQAFREFDVDDKAWVAIISGKGRCFSAGADVKQRQLRPREEMARMVSPGGGRSTGDPLELAQTVNWKPVIAAVHGYTVGVGLTIPMSCDLVVAADDTKFQLTEVKRGLGGATLWVLAWAAGGGKVANDIALTGRFFTAEEGRQMGIVNKVVPPDQLMAEAERLAGEILANPPLAVRCNVRVSRWFVNRMCEEAQLYTRALKLSLSEDFHESALAFVEKRKPVFKGK